MFKVWVLVIYMGASQQGGPTVIDGIATRQECERIQAEFVEKKMVFTTDTNSRYPVYAAARCIEVWKART